MVGKLAPRRPDDRGVAPADARDHPHRRSRDPLRARAQRVRDAQAGGGGGCQHAGARPRSEPMWTPTRSGGCGWDSSWSAASGWPSRARTSHPSCPRFLRPMITLLRDPTHGDEDPMNKDHPNHKWWTLFAMCFALFMIMLDNTVVNVALPSIQRDARHASREPRVDDQRLRPHVRRADPARRQARRPLRPQAHVPGRARRSSPSASRRLRARARRTRS